ncbi:hypothetical protein [Streptomyces sp. NPDC059994]|uniref:hypothetical protein n=1 Tax=Streptomyces sp. NPDC059994 TaxID=3347029 RepID=UPI0036750565
MEDHAVYARQQGHRLANTEAQTERESCLCAPQLTAVLDMLCEEEVTHVLSEGVYAPGRTLERLVAPGSHGNICERAFVS